MQAVPVLVSDGEETGEWHFEHSGANKSLELLGKHLKLFTDKLELSGQLATLTEAQIDARIAALTAKN